jgi:hypothetical protein
MAVDGTYEVEIDTPMGKQKGELILKTDGDALSGTLENPMMGTQEFSGGTVNGDDVAWTMEMNSPLGSITLEYKLIITGDDISGDVKAGNFGTSSLKGKRI